MPVFPMYRGPALLEQVVGVENLTLAWRRVRSNIEVVRRGRSAGGDLVTLRDFEADWTSQMTRLAEELRMGTYRPLPARRVTIPKASGGERAIAILAIRDRVAQRAVQQVLQPLFEPLLLDCSYGCRLFVGVPEAVTRVARYADQGLLWAVDADIASYFDTIDHRILMGLLRQRIDEPAILHLISQWLQVGTLHQPEDAPDGSEPTGLARLLQQGGTALRGMLTEPPPPPLPAMPPGVSDLYAAASWEQPDFNGWGAARRPGLDTGGLLAALSLVQPALNGARQLAPHLQRIGPQRLLLGGALAAGAVAVSELALRAHAASATRGAPQGGALSPLLANIYLHPFDLAMTSHGLRLVRYLDDLVVMCASRDEAERALILMQRQLATLHLQLNEAKTSIVAYADGLEFLGQALAPRSKGSAHWQGLANFEEAEQALREASRQAGKQMRDGADRMRAQANQVRRRMQRKPEEEG
ncbi:reverse transcriptase domain-containing protein [Candidatus Chloroploca sp. Khr17]|uniref:reverse transcriptase domain-containing protein n=1 Tax=Candidatus Chloroploca sp. Khr17 TaxID=2496869 RepID=UPI00101DD46B|nr:reverse transcriptase domain-containing protein [Candidatus Chloroploca sp. Khr17]